MVVTAGSRATGSASSSTRCATSSRSTSRARSTRSAASATPGSSTRASSGVRPRSSRPRWTPPACAPPRGTWASLSPSTRPPGRRRSPTRDTLGSRYIVHPFFGVNDTGPIRDSATYRAFAHDLNRAGALAKRAGLKFGYHNHHFEFFRLDGGTRTGFDILTEETDPDLVHFEMDLFWVTRGAHDPVDLIHANRGRIRQFHVKDMNADGSFEDAGQGLIDFARIFGHSREAGIAEYIIERDNAGTAPRVPADALTTAEVGYRYLAGLRF